MKIRTLIPLFAVAISLHQAPAAVVIESTNTAYTQNFDTFAGTEATLPANFTVTPAGVGMTYNGYYNRSDIYGNLSRIVALRDNPSSTDVAFGMKPQSSGGISTLDWTFQNQTGAAISSFLVSWDFEQYTESGRSNEVYLSYSINGGAFATTGITGSSTSTATTRESGSGTLSAIRLDSKSVTIDLGTLLAPGENVVFRWNFNNGTLREGGSNNAAYVGVDNLSVTAIPEPSSLALAGVALGGLLVMRFRKLNRATKSLPV